MLNDNDSLALVLMLHYRCFVAVGSCDLSSLEMPLMCCDQTVIAFLITGHYHLTYTEVVSSSYYFII